MRLIPAFALLLPLMATAAAAHERCDVPKPGVHISFGISYGHRDYETQQDFDRMLLKQQGVDAKQVSRSSDGCLQALVKDGTGWKTLYFDPDTGERKLDTWENQGLGGSGGIDFGID